MYVWSMCGCMDACTFVCGWISARARCSVDLVNPYQAKCVVADLSGGVRFLCTVHCGTPCFAVKIMRSPRFYGVWYTKYSERYSQILVSLRE